MGRHVNSVSLNCSIEAAYKLSIYTLGSCIPPCCVSFKGYLLFFVHYACNTIYIFLFDAHE